MRRLVYISGPITDSDLRKLADNLQAFTRAENYLWREGFAALNPASDWGAYCLGGISYQMCMERDVALLHAVAAFNGANWQLPGWQSSQGAVAEYHLCRDLGIPCVEEAEGIGRLHDVLRDDFVATLSWSPDD